MKLARNDIFFQFPRYKLPTSQGDVDMPILYFDNSQWLFIFRTDVERAKKLLPQGLKPVTVAGKALVGLAFYEYRDTSIGSYNEVGTAIACLPDEVKAPAITLMHVLKPAAESRIGFHVVDLPVTTEAACSAGREIWGLPKFVTDIGYTENGNQFEGNVALPDNSGNIVSIAGKSGLGVSRQIIDLVLYSFLNKKMLRALVNTHGVGQFCTGGSLKLTLANTDHPMGKRLDILGLNGKSPFMVIRTTELQLRLNAGSEVN